MKQLRILAIFSCLVYGPAMAADRDGEFGIGLGTPAPTGISMKYWTSRITAYDFFAEWAFDEKKINVHFDYLFHDYKTVFMDDAESPVYWGFGARFIEESNEDVITGIRFPIGISYLPNNKPFELFAEAAARINVTPSTSFGVDLIV
ncbi:MAG: hypothetical protein ACC707_16575, partial [Thiohalomonadales bacterium]